MKNIIIIIGVFIALIIACIFYIYNQYMNWRIDKRIELYLKEQNNDN